VISTEELAARMIRVARQVRFSAYWTPRTCAALGAHAGRELNEERMHPCVPAANSSST